MKHNITCYNNKHTNNVAQLLQPDFSLYPLPPSTIPVPAKLYGYQIQYRPIPNIMRSLISISLSMPSYSYTYCTVSDLELGVYS